VSTGCVELLTSLTDLFSRLLRQQTHVARCLLPSCVLLLLSLALCLFLFYYFFFFMVLLNSSFNPIVDIVRGYLFWLNLEVVGVGLEPEDVAVLGVPVLFLLRFLANGLQLDDLLILLYLRLGRAYLVDLLLEDL